MCGIVGYIGKQKALPVLVDGLRNLEYRGYDSAGVVVFDGKKTVFEKAVGKIAALEEKLSVLADIDGRIGIAHTRWATHGGVTEDNAHPHFDCEKNIFVVHNGIIENYKELKAELIKAGHKFHSETDTEVFAHLIEEIIRQGNNSTLEEAVREALDKIRGTYGIVVFDKREPDKLIAARNFSSLVLGIGKDEFIIASDASAILKLTRDVVYLNNGEMLVVSLDSYRITTIDNKPVVAKSEVLDWDIGTAQKNGYPHFMLKEIFEEPDAVRNSLRGRLIVNEGKAVLGGLKKVEDKLRGTKRFIICGCGTAYLAGRVGEYMFEEYAGIPAEVDLGSEFRYRKPVFQKDDAFLAVSQSGETADTLASLYEAKEKSVLPLGIVNVVGSSISRETEAGVYQHIGPENSVASTKAFVSQVAILSLFSLFLGRQREMSLVTGKRIAEELQKIPGFIEDILYQSSVIEKIAQKYKRYDNFFYLGRKYNYPVALEGALKLKEISYIHAEGYSSGEMKHGPIAMIDEGFPTVIIAPHDSVYEKNLSNIQEIKARRGLVLAIATEGDKEIKNMADDVIYIPKTLEMLTPLLSVVPLHLFAYYMGVVKGRDIDRPRNLAKSVTVE